MLAHAMTEVPDIMRATFKRDEKTYFFVDQPTVYKSNTQDVYVVFGTVRVDNGETSNLLQQAAAQKFQAPRLLPLPRPLLRLLPLRRRRLWTRPA